MQELEDADRTALAQELLAHGAPAAGRLLADRADGRLTGDDVVAVTQDLLALAPVEAEQLADRLYGHAAAGSLTPTAPPPVPAAARQPVTGVDAPRRSGPVVSSASPVPAERGAATVPARGATARSPVSRESASRHPADAGARALAEQLAREPRLRARRQALAAGGAGGPLDVDTLLEMLADVPDGWQRRAALRRVLTVAPVAVGARGHELLQPFTAPGDRFAVAALLVRCGLASVTAVTPSLEPTASRRLEARAARAARRPPHGTETTEESRCAST